MAINRSDYPHKVDVGLWANNLFVIFLYRFNYEKKEYSGLIDLSSKSSWSKKDKISHAKSEMNSIKNKKKDSVQNENITLDNLMQEYFVQLPKTNYVKTRKSHYERYVSPICGSKKVVELRQLHIRNSIAFQEEKGLSPRTVKQTLEVLAPAFKNAIANRLIAFNPLDGIKIKLPKTKKIVSHASEELVKIHTAIYAEYGHDPFYLAFFLFALQGRRRGEIMTLKWEDVNFDKSYYVLRDTKNNEEQKIFLPQTIKDNLLLIPKISEWVFTSRITGGHVVDIRKATDKLKVRLDNSAFGIHYLRNVIVSTMAEQGLDSIYLSGALGHNDPNTIKKYLTMNYLKSSEMASGVIDGVVGK
ncbi:MAG: tyrosine-type recombinase/integrase [Campylobacterales bacterium]|nr:tyrosine-type recombinase/integrase [Campylobacterales bacterium]